MSLLQVTNIHFRYNGADILKGISFPADEGGSIAIAGPNGSGKTTLLKLIQRLRVPTEGEILLSGRNLKLFSIKEVSQIVAGVWERQQTGFRFTVRQFVSLGRTPYLNLLKFEGKQDHEVVDRVLEEVECRQFEDRALSELSAGEFQRVCIAAALAQQPKILLLDEPTNFLDLKHQIRLSHLLKRLQEKGILILCASHDVSFMHRNFQKVLLLKDGEQWGFGDTAEMLSDTNLGRLFELEEEFDAR